MEMSADDIRIAALVAIEHDPGISVETDKKPCEHLEEVEGNCNKRPRVGET